MPTAITIRLRPDQPGIPDTRQVHGLACTLFEGAHTTQRKPFTVWPITPDQVDQEAGSLLRASWLPDISPYRSTLVRSTASVFLQNPQCDDDYCPLR